MGFFKNIRNKLWYRRIAYFFPLQLFLLHLKRNHLLLFFWVLLFGFITQTFATKYGIPYLFLEPEYMGHVGMRSHFILGVCIGVFIMAYNLSSYILIGTSFPFIVTLYRPLLKYSINNSVIPIIFITTYIWESVYFQSINNYSNALNVILNISAFLGGILCFTILSFTYFFSTMKNVFKLFGLKDDIDGNPIFPINFKKLDKKRRLRASKWRIETYLSDKFSVRLVRSGNHYTADMIDKVFRQNHSSASIFQILLILIIVCLGLYRDNLYLTIPAGGSLVLITSVFLMLFSAINYWLRGWSNALLILSFVIFNYLPELGVINPMSKAYGLSYSTKAEYSDKNIQASQTDIQADLKSGQKILYHWKQKNKKNISKPKLLFINPSGGGLRSAMWTFRALQFADSVSNGRLLKQTHLISGSSGGMLGASYLRELYLLKQQKKIENLYHPKYLNNIGKDLLNPIVYSMAVNDLFISLQSFTVGDEKYQKNRAYAFEKEFNINTDSILNKSIGDYQLEEEFANIPLMFISTTNINDGKRFIISPQQISYMNNTLPKRDLIDNPLSDEIEFTKMFEKQGGHNLKFTSALRMNATFPYIFPAVSLPSEPEAVVMDAGGRDNFGIDLSLKYLYAHKKWISENTSGVIILQTRGKEKHYNYSQKGNTIINRFVRPLGSMYENLSNIHDYNHDQLIKYASTWYKGSIDVINLSLKNPSGYEVSLSWHLTKKEKLTIINSIYSAENQKELDRLIQLIN